MVFNLLDHKMDTPKRSIRFLDYAPTPAEYRKKMVSFDSLSYFNANTFFSIVFVCKLLLLAKTIS